MICYDTSDNRWYIGTRYHNSGYGIGFEGISITTTEVVIQNLPNSIDWSARSSNAYAIIRYYKTS